MKLSSARRASAIAIAAIGIGLFAGCSAGAPERDTETNEITEAGDADVYALTVGDCLDDATGTEVTEVPVVPCDQPHDNEVIYSFDMPEGDFPGQEAFTAAALEQCPPAFTEYVGIAWEESMYDVWPMTPTEAGWTQGGDHEILCLAFDPTLTKIEGSVKGTAR